MISIWRKFAPKSFPDGPSWRQYRPMRAQVRAKMAPCVLKLGPRWTKLGQKRSKVGANMPPNELSLVTSWLQECMKAGRSKTLKNPMKNNDFSGLRCPSWAQDGKDACKVGHKLAPVAPNLAKVRPSWPQVEPIWHKIDAETAPNYSKAIPRGPKRHSRREEMPTNSICMFLVIS